MGCAKFATNSTYTVTGTPDYFAPEIIKVNPYKLCPWCPWLIIRAFVNLKNICCYHLAWYSMVCIIKKRFSYHTQSLNVGKHLPNFLHEYGHLNIWPNIGKYRIHTRSIWKMHKNSFLCSARPVGMTSMSIGGHWVFWSSNCWQENRHLSRRIQFRNLAVWISEAFSYVKLGRNWLRITADHSLVDCWFICEVITVVQPAE